MGRAGCTLVVIASLSSTARAQGQERPPVSLDLRLDEPGCGVTDREALLRVVRLELEGATVAEATGDAVSATRVTVSCQGDLVALRVDDPITGKALERSVSLAGVVAPVRARIVGLAIVELVAASWIELELRRPPPAEDIIASAAQRRTEHAAVAVARRRLPAPARRGLVLDAAVGERQHDNDLLLRAVEVRGSYRASWLRLGLDGRYEAGSRGLEMGTVDVDAWTGGARATAALVLDRLELEAGLGGRAGGARLAGRSFIGARERSFWAPVASVYGVAMARAWATERWAVHIGGDGGVILAGVDATVSGQTRRVLRGKFVGVTAGLAVAF
jgi:hypothetical protein